MDIVPEYKRKVGSWTEEQKLKGQLSRAKQLKVAADLTLEQWQETLDYFGHKCAYCLGPYQVIEHYMPVDVAGTTASNCVPACFTCNIQKDSQGGQRLRFYNNKRVVDFLTSRGAKIKIHVHQYQYRKKHSDVMEIYCRCGYTIGIYGNKKDAEEYIEEMGGVLCVVTKY